MKPHRPTRNRAVKSLTGCCFGPRFNLQEKPRDDVDKVQPLRGHVLERAEAGLAADAEIVSLMLEVMHVAGVEEPVLLLISARGESKR